MMPFDPILIGTAMQMDDNITTFRYHLRKITDNTRMCDLLHGQVSDHVVLHACTLHEILAKYVTDDDFDHVHEGNTKSLDFLSEASRGRTGYEAVAIYLVAAHTFPDHRWKYCFRHLRPSSKHEWESALLEAYLTVTSPRFATFFHMLFSKPTKARAFSLSAIYILSPGEYDLARVSRRKLGTSTSRFIKSLLMVKE